MLAGTLQLHDVRDVEQFAGRAMVDELRARRIRLEPADREDLHAYLVAAAWELSTRYDPARARLFSSYAYPILRKRVVDWLRSRLRAPSVWPGADLGERSRMDEAVGAWTGDPADSRSPDLVRVLAPRGSQGARRDRRDSEGAAGRARGGDRGADGRAVR